MNSMTFDLILSIRTRIELNRTLNEESVDIVE